MLKYVPGIQELLILLTKSFTWRCLAATNPGSEVSAYTGSFGTFLDAASAQFSLIVAVCMAFKRGGCRSETGSRNMAATQKSTFWPWFSICPFRQFLAKTYVPFRHNAKRHRQTDERQTTRHSLPKMRPIVWLAKKFSAVGKCVLSFNWNIFWHRHVDFTLNNIGA